MTVTATRPTDLDQLVEWVARRCADNATGNKQPKQSGDSWSVCCPAHDDSSPSLSISPGTHPDGAVVIHCHAGCTPDQILQAAGLDRRDLFTPKPLPAITPATTITPTPPATYTYHDADGTPIGQVVRTSDKKFWRKKPDGNGGWVNGGFGDVLYNLPAVLSAIDHGRMIAIVEGEKDVDRLADIGIVATCNVGGAGKWRDHMAHQLEGARVVVLPDNDKAGRDHANTIIASLLQRDSGNVRLVRLLGLPPKGDVSDWLDAGHTHQDLVDEVKATAPSKTAPLPDPTDNPDDEDEDLTHIGGWTPLDLTPYLDGTYQRPEPTFLSRTDLTCLLYPGRTHTLFGPPESGKTWVALCAAAEALTQQLDVIYLDFENSPEDIVAKLRLLGVTDDRLANGLIYIQPDRPLSEADGATLHQLTEDRPVGLVVIDGVTNVMGLHGLDDNQGTDVSSYDRMLPKPLIRNGAALVQVDHTAKHTDDGNRYAIGSQHKLAVITGAAYLLKVDRNQPFAPGRRGTAQLVIAKDRPGTVRGTSAGNDAGTFVLDSGDDVIEAYIEPPDRGPFRPTHYMQKVSEWLADWPRDPGPTKSQIIDQVSGKNDIIAHAVKLLEEEGHIAVDRTSQGHFHRLVKPFSEVETL